MESTSGCELRWRCTSEDEALDKQVRLGTKCEVGSGKPRVEIRPIALDYLILRHYRAIREKKKNCHNNNDH